MVKRKPHRLEGSHGDKQDRHEVNRRDRREDSHGDRYEDSRDRREDSHGDRQDQESSRHVLPNPSNSDGVPRHTTSLTSLPSGRFTQQVRSGVGGSNSKKAINPRTGNADVIADMAGVLRHSMPRARPPPQEQHQQHHQESSDGEDDQDLMHTPRHSGAPGMSGELSSQAGESRGSSLPLIIRKGYMLGKSEYHREAMRIFWENMDNAWPSYSDIPNEVMDQMFARFRTSYRWYPEHEESIKSGFRNTIAKRYRDRMSDARKESKQKAIDAGEKVGEICDNFAILREHHPKLLHANIWRKLCDSWDTKKWKKMSKTASNNRNSTDSSGRSSRHTGGSIGFAEHRERLAIKYGKEPSWLDVYMQTHLTKESKIRWFAGDRENLQFVNQNAEDAFNAYRDLQLKKHGVDVEDHIVDDPELQGLVDDPALWTQSLVQRGVVPRPGRAFGIGSADLHYLITGSSESASPGPQSQQEVVKLREQIDTMKEAMQQSEKQIETMRQDMQNEVARQMEERERQMQAQNEKLIQQQLAEFLKNYKHP